MQEQRNRLRDIGDEICEIGSDKPRYTPEEAVEISQRIVNQKGGIKFPKTKAITQLARANHKNIRTILTHDTKMIEQALGTPSKLARNFMGQERIDVNAWFTFLNDYLLRPGSAVAKDPRMRNTRRGNINRQVALDNMSWNVLEQILAIGKVARMRVTLGYQMVEDIPHGVWREVSSDTEDLQQHVDTMNQLEFCFGDIDEQSSGESGK